MKKLLIYLKFYKKESVLGPLFKLIEAAFELFVPIVMAKMIDIGIANSDRPYIFKMAGVLVLLGFVGLLLSVTAQYFAAKASVGFVKKLRHAVFAHIQSLSFTELDEVGTPTLITRMTGDMNQVQTGVNLSLRLLLRSPLVVFGAMGMAFFIDVQAALIFVVTIVLLSVIVFTIMGISIPLYKKVQDRLDTVLSSMRENLVGVRVLRAFCKEQEEVEKFGEENAILTRFQKFSGAVSALTNPLTYIVVNLAIVWLIHTGAVRVNMGTLTQGEVVALYNYMTQILVELIKFANLIVTITKSVACGNRIQSVLEIVPSQKDAESVTPQKTTSCDVPKISFEHVSFTYKNGGRESISDITFSCSAGETVGIIGGTGSGKSTLVHMIPRFYDATSGTVSVDGINVCNYPMEELRSKIGIVMQKAVLFHGTIRENLSWRKNNMSDQEFWEVLSCAQADAFVSEKEGSLDYVIEQGGKNLSGGQRQRLTIARALVGNPEILILDDSASALDLATEANLKKALQELPFHPTTFIVSQRISSIRYADKIIVLDDGAVAGIGTHDELLASCDVYREIYESQGGDRT